MCAGMTHHISTQITVWFLQTSMKFFLLVIISFWTHHQDVSHLKPALPAALNWKHSQLDFRRVFLVGILCLQSANAGAIQAVH